MIPRWLPAIRAELEQDCARWSVPLGVAVGWIEVESGGNPRSTTSLGELGLFQILPAESADLGFDHPRIRTDPAYGIACGFQLVDHYRVAAWRLLRAIGAGVEEGSELHWRFAKFCHSIGGGAAKACMASAGLMCGAWATFSAYCAAHDAELLARLKHSPVKWIGIVDRAFAAGAPYGLSALICPPI